ncbi:hypothetical protein BJ138DRAFT_1181044 [Hygrophoropsis aurantiaca]|uniref:Uncharacterized protein n=1 Tax=Hygrophoropsis aurantiaca TaxID=72124 RepID=A0ACB8A7J4_9AGAM|nr:hypothetical protein BJ138DRAFT_1181044 [Hygrophoropsis aurantiaca]
MVYICTDALTSVNEAYVPVDFLGLDGKMDLSLDWLDGARIWHDRSAKSKLFEGENTRRTKSEAHHRRRDMVPRSGLPPKANIHPAQPTNQGVRGWFGYANISCQRAFGDAASLLAGKDTYSNTSVRVIPAEKLDSSMNVVNHDSKMIVMGIRVCKIVTDVPLPMPTWNVSAGTSHQMEVDKQACHYCLRMHVCKGISLLTEKGSCSCTEDEYTDPETD